MKILAEQTFECFMENCKSLTPNELFESINKNCITIETRDIRDLLIHLIFLSPFEPETIQVYCFSSKEFSGKYFSFTKTKPYEMNEEGVIEIDFATEFSNTDVITPYQLIRPYPIEKIGFIVDKGSSHQKKVRFQCKIMVKV